jgi:hypothetical protein
MSAIREQLLKNQAFWQRRAMLRFDMPAKISASRLAAGLINFVLSRQGESRTGVHTRAASRPDPFYCRASSGRRCRRICLAI